MIRTNDEYRESVRDGVYRLDFAGSPRVVRGAAGLSERVPAGSGA